MFKCALYSVSRLLWYDIKCKSCEYVSCSKLKAKSVCTYVFKIYSWPGVVVPRTQEEVLFGNRFPWNDKIFT